MIETVTMKLADLRHRAGLSQPQVAERMGVSRAQVSRIEAMYPSVMFPTLRAYMDAIDLEIRFTGEIADMPVDVSSSDVEEDRDRIYAESRRKDKSRGGRSI